MKYPPTDPSERPMITALQIREIFPAILVDRERSLGRSDFDGYCASDLSPHEFMLLLAR
jgi:hypothetical protein